MNRPLISPIDCRHLGMRLIQESRGGPGGYREFVGVCPACGEFTVWISKNGESHRVAFTLSTKESVAAAGRYLEYIESEGDR